MPKWLEVLKAIGPTILAFTPAAPLMPVIIEGIALAEQLPGASGPQKKAVVLKLVEKAEQGASAMGKPPKAGSWVSLADNGIDTVVGAVNAFRDDPETPEVEPSQPE